MRTPGKHVSLCSCTFWALILCLLCAATLAQEPTTAGPGDTAPPGPPASETPPPANGAEGQNAEKAAQEAKKALAEASREIAASVELRARATQTAATLSQLTAALKDDADAQRNLGEEAVRRLDRLLSTIFGIHDGKLLEKIPSQKTALSNQQKALAADGSETACKESFKDDAKRCTVVLTGLKDEVKALEAAETELRNALAGIQSAVQATAAGLRSTMVQPTSTDAETLRRQLPDLLPKLVAVERMLPLLRSRWHAICIALKVFQDSTGKAITCDPALFGPVETDAKQAASSLKAWLGTLTDAVNKTAGVLATKVSDVKFEPAKYADDAQNSIADGNKLHEQVRSILTDSNRLTAYLQKADSDEIKNAASPLQEALEKQLGPTIVKLEDALAGDRSEFVSDQVSLYYFTDVRRVMEILNPSIEDVHGKEAAQLAEEALQRRHDLTSADLELEEAAANVNKYQTRLQVLEEELRQAKAKSKALGGLSKKFDERLASANKNLEKATETSTQKETAAETEGPDQALKKAQAARAAKKKEEATAKAEEAQRDSDNAKSESQAADEQLAAVQDEQKGLPAQIAEAKEALSQAQTTVSAKRKASFLATADEAEAFVKARDNAPYWKTTPIAADTDPARRVEIYGYPDSKTLFLRGKKEDVKKVKDIIEQLDKPAPQARITLWTLELNSTGGINDRNHGVRHFNRALDLMEMELANTRAWTNASLSLFRDKVNKYVTQASQETSDACDNPMSTTIDDPEVKRILAFYDCEVLKILGYQAWYFKSDKDNAWRGFKFVARWTAPDPAATTTLGEVLLILTLGRAHWRARAFCEFERDLPNRLLVLGLDKRPSSSSSDTEPALQCEQAVQKQFTQTRRFLNLDNWDPPKLPKKDCRTWLENQQSDDSCSCQSEQTTGLSPHQLEIARALESAAALKIARRARDISAILTPINSELRKAESERSLGCATSSPQCQELADRIARLKNRRDPLADELAPLAFYLWNRNHPPLLLPPTDQQQALPFGSEQVLKNQLTETVAQGQPQRTSFEAVSSVRGMVDTFLETSPLRIARPRVAAADQMLKEMIIAVEDDIDRLFIHPALSSLRISLTKDKHLQVGILQRTSVLATNRLVARVDPRASAQLALGEEQNVLEGATQLAQLFFAAQTGGLTTTLGMLNAQKKEAPPELYGLNTGAVFKVTPIFDPSGQALRFKFDYVSGTRIQEPNGTTNPQLPRIERHTVNTEVQISNLELREISRFESNAQLGLPEQFWGGVPIIKDIPGIRHNRYIPLLGWFTRKSGQAGAVQESVIFGQTTIYPTIGDLVDLLKDSGEADDSVGGP